MILSVSVVVARMCLAILSVPDRCSPIDLPEFSVTQDSPLVPAYEFVCQLIRYAKE